MINVANMIGLNPKDWQNSAEETRVVAESMQDEQSKQLMLCIAKEYERAAELTQERSKRWRGKSYGIYAAFCTALAAGTCTVVWVHQLMCPSYPLEKLST
jgi:hypothetical protein